MRKGAPGLDKQEEVRMMKQLAVHMQRNWQGAGGELKGRGVCWHLQGSRASGFSQGGEWPAVPLPATWSIPGDLRELPSHASVPSPKGRDGPCSLQKVKDLKKDSLTVYFTSCILISPNEQE